MITLNSSSFYTSRHLIIPNISTSEDRVVMSDHLERVCLVYLCARVCSRFASRRWAELWTETENFGIWQTSHRLADTLADSLTTDRRLRSTRSYPENFTASSTSPNSNGHTRTASATPTAVGAHNKLDDNLARANSIGNASFLKSGGVSPLPIGLLCGAGVAAGAAFDGVTNGSSRGSVKVKKGDGVPESSLEAYTYDSGDVYTGSWSNGKRHGVGVYEERATGNCYEVRGSIVKRAGADEFN